MRTRVLLIAVPLCAVALATGAAGASPDSGEHFKDTKLDDPHVVRPIAASDPAAGSVPDLAFLDLLLLLNGSAPAAEPPPAPEPPPEPPSRAAPVVSSAPAAPGDFFACVRQRESGGNYSIVSANGLYHGAYQFLQSTWDNIARASGRDDLVGLDPANASVGDQDAMAEALYAQQGAAPWGGGCR